MARGVGGGLSGLLGHANLDGFLECAWERDVLLRRGSVGARVGEVLTLDAFEGLLPGAALSEAGSLSVIEGGLARLLVGRSATDRLTAAFDAYRRGCTLLQSELQQRHEPVAALCRDVEQEFASRDIPLSASVGANAYLTPPESRGLAVHYDDHCAVVLQLAGTKRWTVFPPVEALPLQRCVDAIETDRLGAPVLEAVLRAGDVLYLPRGFPHSAVATHDLSLHLTLSLRALRWIDVVEALCERDAAFRRAVGPVTDCAAGDWLARELVPRLAKADVGAQLRRALADDLVRTPTPPSGRLEAIAAACRIPARARVSRAPGVRCVAETQAGEAVLRFSGGEVRLPAAMASVFEFIARREVFEVSELPGERAVYDREELLRILIGRGLLRLETTTAPALESDSTTAAVEGGT